MNRRQILLSTAATALAASASPALARQSSGASMPQPPVAKKIPVVIEQLGRTRTDDYQWMKDDNWQAVLRDPTLIKAEVKEHLTAENAYREAMMASTLPLQETMFQEMRGRIKEDDSSVPAPDGDWTYYVEYRTGDQHPRYMRVERQGTWMVDGRPVTKNFIVAPTPQLLLDANELAEGKAYSEVSAAAHSPDHSLFAYAEDAQGSEVHKIYVKDLATGAVLPDVIESATGDFTFSPDSRWIFWTNRDDNGRPDKIFRRPARGGETTLVYEEADDGMFIGVGRTADDRFIVIGIQNQETSEARYIPADDPTAAPVVLEPRQVAVRYDVDHWDDRWVIRTNADDAIDFKIVQAPTETPGRAHWTDLVPHTPGRFIEGMDLTRHHLARQERADANTRIIIRDRAGAEHAIAVDEPAFALSLSGASEFDTTTTRYSYNSPSTPTQTYDYDMASRERTLRKTQEIPSGHNIEDYVVERLNAPAADGQLVPVTVLRRRTTPIDGSAPLLLYGYGSYGMSMPASFSPHRLGLVQRGFVHAIAHVRGGMERGYRWYTAGKLMKKRNTFEDFIAAAETLCEAGFGRAGEIAIQGGSAGGLLVGAAMNLRPDLFRAVVAEVPFVDVLTTILDDSLPLTPPEWTEWGNPIESEEAYRYMKSYSPYDNVEAGAYPDLLITAGLTDPRVTYWEPAKWSAKLRALRTDDNLQLLHTVMTAGHAGSAGRYDRLKEIALVQAFLLKVFGRAGE